MDKPLYEDETIKVNFEVDCNPVSGFLCDSRWLNVSKFANTKVFDIESLFAGKTHANNHYTSVNTDWRLSIKKKANIRAFFQFLLTVNVF